MFVAIVAVVAIVSNVAIVMNVREVVGVKDALRTNYAYFQSIDCKSC
jgi:hypothetical protein